MFTSPQEQTAVRQLSELETALAAVETEHGLQVHVEMRDGPAAQVVASVVRTTGADIVVLLDSSASMHVTDVKGDRWQRSMHFLRTLGEALRWENDRVAMALFAHMATPQIRLTKDPNTYFFFLDHLAEKSPFRLEDDGTWDTNIERGIYWGLRLIEKDEELRKIAAQSTKMPEANNARAFVLVTDGQSWSGEVAKSLALAQGRSIRGRPEHDPSTRRARDGQCSRTDATGNHEAVEAQGRAVGQGHINWLVLVHHGDTNLAQVARWVQVRPHQCASVERRDHTECDDRGQPSRTTTDAAPLGGGHGRCARTRVLRIRVYCGTAVIARLEFLFECGALDVDSGHDAV